jgi:hypothetical protein
MRSGTQSLRTAAPLICPDAMAETEELLRQLGFLSGDRSAAPLKPYNGCVA